MEPMLSRLPFLDWEENGWVAVKKKEKRMQMLETSFMLENMALTHLAMFHFTRQSCFLGCFFPPETRSRTPISVQTL